MGAAPVAVAVLVLLAGGPAGAGPPAQHDHPAPPAPATTGDGISQDTRLVVLSGFGAANVAVLGTAMVLRQRGQRRPRRTPAR